MPSPPETLAPGQTRSGKPRLAVVLLNLGGPDSLDAVQPFLFNLFNDRAIIDLPNPFRFAIAKLISKTRRKEASANYAHMGGASPLLGETQAQAVALEAVLADRLAGYESKVFLAMRYWRPFTHDAAAAVAEFAPTEVVLLPLYPQYSTTTTGSSIAAWRKAYRGGGRVRTACCYFDEPGFVAAHVRKIRETFDAAGRPKGVRLLFSAHGLPQKIIDKGDPYQSQVERTCEAVMAELGPGWDWQVCYQSRVGPLKWLGPATPEAIKAAADEGLGVLIVPIAFVSEHVETLVELDRDYAELAQALGCPIYLRAPALGSDPAFIEGLVRTVARSLPSARSEPGASACSTGFARCPYRTAKALAA
jgi:ferrochelatase